MTSPDSLTKRPGPLRKRISKARFRAPWDSYAKTETGIEPGGENGAWGHI
jgi:hypothetical protein